MERSGIRGVLMKTRIAFHVIRATPGAKILSLMALHWGRLLPMWYADTSYGYEWGEGRGWM